MYEDVGKALLRLILLDKYLIEKFTLKRSKYKYFIFLKKYDDRKLELVMSVHVEYVFMVGKPEKLDKIKDIIRQEFNMK